MYKKILVSILDKVFELVVSQISESELDEIAQEWAHAWVTKHVTVDELKNEANDFGKWFRKKVLGK